MRWFLELSYTDLSDNLQRQRVNWVKITQNNLLIKLTGSGYSNGVSTLPALAVRIIPRWLHVAEYCAPIWSYLTYIDLINVNWTFLAFNLWDTLFHLCYDFLFYPVLNLLLCEGKKQICWKSGCTWRLAISEWYFWFALELSFIPWASVWLVTNWYQQIMAERPLFVVWFLFVTNATIHLPSFDLPC